MIKKLLYLIFPMQVSSQTIDLNYKLSKEDKILIDRKLKEDIYNKSDLKNQVRPEISPIDYYRLNNMDFNWVVLDPMSEMVTKYSEKTQTNLPEAIKVISPEQKLLYFWWYLDGQVGNGGFSQFIYNGYSEYFQPILNGLKLLPDKKYYELVEKVYLYYLREKMDQKDLSKIDYFKDRFYENKFLSDATSEYLKMKEQLYKDVEIFIRDNQNKFIKPITINYTGRIEHKTDNVTELLEVQNGIAEGKYTKHIDNVKAEEIIYRQSKSIIKKEFKEGKLYKEVKEDDTIKTLVHTLKYHSNGKLKEHTKNIVIDRYNSEFVYRKRFYDSGIIKAEFLKDATNKTHVKRYFVDGQLRSYYTFKNLDDDSPDNPKEYIICFDENRKESLIEGTGVFYDYDFPEDMGLGFYKTIVNCKNHLAHGESTTYRNEKLNSRTTYVNGKQHGVAIDYDENGNEKMIREFENGLFVRRIK